jgi:hypothetical protein
MAVMNKQITNKTGDSTMFRKMTIAVVPALVFALAAFSTNNSASQAFANGHGGGHRGGGHAASHRSAAHRSVNHRSGVHRSAAHKVTHAKHSAKGHGHWRRYGFGLDGDADAVDVDGLDSITLVNPQETRATVGYTLDSAQYSLDPAQSQVYEGGTQVIVFDRGGSFGQAQYTLQPGTYRFVSTDRGWDLRTVTEQVAAN